jgi:hypothetical protein
MARITIGINNPSHEDQSPKMLFLPCQLPSMVIDGSYNVNLDLGLLKGIKDLLW